MTLIKVKLTFHFKKKKKIKFFKCNSFSNFCNRYFRLANKYDISVNIYNIYNNINSTIYSAISSQTVYLTNLKIRGIVSAIYEFKQKRMRI